MATDRRIIFGTHVSIRESSSGTEESIGDKWIVYPGIGKSVGGKGIATTTEDFLDDQWSDSWCSMGSDKKFWEDYADATDVSGNRWEDSYNSWNNKRWVGTGANQLSSGLSTAVDIDAGFLYIKNLGDQEVHVSLDGSSGDYDLLIPSGASISFRGNTGGATTFHVDDVYVKTASGETYIDYVLEVKT